MAKRLYEVGIYDFPKEIVQLLAGFPIFRTSYGQNVLFHTIEMAQSFPRCRRRNWGANVEVAKKGAMPTISARPLIRTRKVRTLNWALRV